MNDTITTCGCGSTVLPDEPHGQRVWHRTKQGRVGYVDGCPRCNQTGDVAVVRARESIEGYRDGYAGTPRAEQSAAYKRGFTLGARRRKDARPPARFSCFSDPKPTKVAA